MKRLTTFLFLILFAFALQGQKVLTYGGKVLTYDGKVLIQDYVPESEVIFAAMGTTPNAARKRLIDNLVRGLKADGIWTKLDFLYLLAAHAENSSLLNWINPGTFDATNVHVTAFEVDRGYTGDGANDYLRTNWIPSTDGINYALNDASMGVYVRTNISRNECEIGAFTTNPSGSYFYIITRWGDGIAYFAVNNSGAVSIINTDSRGFFISSRILNNEINLYKNKTNILTSPVSSSHIVDREVYILSRNIDGVTEDFSTKQVAAAFAGSGMTQTNVNNFTDRIETFMDAIGAGIID